MLGLEGRVGAVAEADVFVGLGTLFYCFLCTIL